MWNAKMQNLIAANIFQQFKSINFIHMMCSRMTQVTLIWGQTTSPQILVLHDDWVVIYHGGIVIKYNMILLSFSVEIGKISNVFHH